MIQTTNIRMERVERLFRELRYEIERGMIEGDVPEYIGYRFYVPHSQTHPRGVVFCEFRTRPTEYPFQYGEADEKPKWGNTKQQTQPGAPARHP